MATRGVHLLCVSAAWVTTTFHMLSVVAVPTVRDTNSEIEFDFVGRGPGPEEQQRRNKQEGAQRNQTMMAASDRADFATWYLLSPCLRLSDVLVPPVSARTGRVGVSVTE